MLRSRYGRISYDAVGPKKPAIVPVQARASLV